jgi:uncharacterized protein
MNDNLQIHWTADSILDFLRNHSDDLKAMGVIKIGLFGSYVRGEQSPSSDADFLFMMQDFNWQGWMDVWNFLEDNLGLSIDLVPEQNLREELRPTVMHEVRYVKE